MTIDLKIKFQQKLSLILIILITSAISNALSASINIDNENYVDLKNVVSYIENSNIDDDYSFFADPNVIFNSSAIDQQQNHIYYNYQQNFSFFDQIEQNNADMVNTENVTDTRSLLMFSPSITVLLAVLSGLMSLITILGNILVITAFIIDKNLRSYSNYFILNLSIADLLIGLLIPPYAPFLLANRRWVLGRAACTIWLVLDYVVGSASVLCIVVISLDRYLLVSRGLNYVAKQKVSKAICIMVTVWVIAFLNYAPAIVFWELISGKSTVPEGDCQVEFHNNLAYLTATACVEFFVPLISICTLNIAVYLNIRKRSKGLIRSKNPQFCIVNDDNQKGSLNNNKTDANNSSNKANNGSVKVSPIKTHKKETNGKITKAIISMSPSTSSASSEISPICQYKVVDIKSQQSTVNNNNDKHYKNTSCPQFNNPPQITATTTSTIGGNTTVTTSITNKSINDSEIESKKTLNKKNLKLKISNSESTNLSKVSSKVKRTSLSSKTPSSSNSLSKDKKAARSLFILVFVFVCCWAPYTSTTLVKSVCPTCVDDHFYEVTFWLLWLNSTFNPILYPFLHVKFRKAFSKILCFCFCSLCNKFNIKFKTKSMSFSNNNNNNNNNNDNQTTSVERNRLLPTPTTNGDKISSSTGGVQKILLNVKHGSNSSSNGSYNNLSNKGSKKAFI